MLFGEPETWRYQITWEIGVEEEDDYKRQAFDC